MMILPGAVWPAIVRREPTESGSRVSQPTSSPRLPSQMVSAHIEDDGTGPHDPAGGEVGIVQAIGERAWNVPVTIDFAIKTGDVIHDAATSADGGGAGPIRTRKRGDRVRI